MNVSQKLILKNRDSKILALHKSPSDSTRPSTWDLPGGQLEEGELLENSARREVREETGLEIGSLRFIHADARNAKSGDYWVVLFSVADAIGDSVTLSEEHDAYEWLTREEFLLRESSDRIRELFESLIDF